VHKVGSLQGGFITKAPPFKSSHLLNKKELQEFKAQINDLMEQGYMRPNKSPYGSHVLFMDKKDGKLHMYIDYHTLNKITIKSNYPLPQINNPFDRPNGAFYFSRIDLKLSYYQIHMQDVDVEKTTMKTRYGSYKFLVMPFGLCNTLSTFTTFMNLIFHNKLDKFVIIYIDNILVYSKSIEEHVTHLKFVLQKFKENKLYANQAKSEFASLEMDFLGHVLFREGVRPNPRKIESIKEWKSLI